MGLLSTFQFVVQGSRVDAGPDVFADEIDYFLDHQYTEFISNRTQFGEKLEKAKKAVKDTLMKKPTNAQSKWNLLKSDIFNVYERDFNSSSKMLEAMNDVSAEDILHFFKENLIGTRKRKISSQVCYILI